MKRSICLVIILCLSGRLISQTSISLSTDKTTSLVFPFAISHVDRGTPSILAQPVKDIPTILLLKASDKDFPETNLSVVTNDGSLYSFLVYYKNKPDQLVYHLPVYSKNSPASYSNSILDNPPTIKNIQDKKWDIISKVKGIYIRQDVIYYQLEVENKGPINYSIDLIRFYIRDRKKGKRTAVQENDLNPINVAGNISSVNANSSSAMVFAFDKFTIPDGKYLAVQIMEKDGGRHLSMKINNKKIMKAIILPDLK